MARDFQVVRSRADLPRLDLPRRGVPAVFLLLAGFLSWQETCRADAGANAARIDQRVRVAVTERAIEIEYATQLNRPAAFAEVLKIDTNRDGRLSPAEQTAYFGKLAETLRRGLELRVGGRDAKLEPLGQVKLEMPFRKTYRFQAPHPAAWRRGAAVELHNENYLNYGGQLEIEITAGEGVDVVYDSLGAAASDNVFAPTPTAGPFAAERDVVFCYRAGGGRYAADAAPELAEQLMAGPHETIAAGTVALRRPRPDHRGAIWLAVLLAVLGGGLGMLGWRRESARVPAWTSAAAVWLAVGCLALSVSRDVSRQQQEPHRLSPAQAIAQFQRLHRGVYRAFAETTEDAIYDRLAECLSGHALRVAYNEVYDAVLGDPERQDRFSIRRVKPIRTSILPPDGSMRRPNYRVQYRWRVGGTVTHANHAHARVNEYAAVYTVSLGEEGWRISDIELRQHKRLSTDSAVGA